MGTTNQAKPRILIVNRDLGCGGGITYITHLASGLVAHGWDVHFQSIPGPMAGRVKESGAKIAYKGWGHPLQTAFLIRMLRDLKPDVVNSHANSTTCALAAACRATGTKFVVTAHSLLEGKSPKRWRAMQAAYRHADAVVSMNDRTAAYYTENFHIEPRRTMLSRLFVPWRDVAPTPLTNPVHLMYCARLSSTKGRLAGTFLQAGLNLGYPVTIVGDGKIKRKLEKLGGNFVGHSDSVSSIFGSATVAGGTGFVAIEALEAGCVPVAIGVQGCQGAVTPESIEWAASRNYGDADPCKYETTVEGVEQEIHRAVQLYGGAGRSELWARAREIHAQAMVVPTMEAFFQRVIRNEPFDDLSIDVGKSHFMQERPR